MKKTIFLWAFLTIVGVSSVNAQMRISGSDAPNKSAILDLNPDNEISKGNATLGVALPRVMLKNTHDASPLEAHVQGMTVYNVATTGDVTPGIYISNGVQWIRQIDTNTTSLVVQKDSIIGNEVTDATAGSGLIRSGAGTKVSPYTLGVAPGGITNDKLADGSVTINKITQKTIIELGDSLATNVYNTVLGDSILNYITQNFNTAELRDTIMQYLTNNLDNSALMDSVANYISHNNSYLTTLIDNVAQNIYNTTLGDSIVNYISNNITTTLLGDSIANYIANNIRNTILGDTIVNLIHDSELDGVIGNEVTDATVGGGLSRSGAGTAASPYTLGVAAGGITADKIADKSITFNKFATNVTLELGDSIANNIYNTVLGDSILNYIIQNFNTAELRDTIMQYFTNNLDHSALMDSIANYVRNNNSYLTALIENIAQNVGDF
ncbi:hypothetical protein AGMMS49525_16790 [Bacteroidia bacterium]|nr:hypothetical protein AGMMS49525_16790 [Bacteroidia bacterium]